MSQTQDKAGLLNFIVIYFLSLISGPVVATDYSFDSNT